MKYNTIKLELSNMEIKSGPWSDNSFTLAVFDNLVKENCSWVGLNLPLRTHKRLKLNRINRIACETKGSFLKIVRKKSFLSNTFRKGENASQKNLKSHWNVYFTIDLFFDQR